jgi:hypothetical protein
MSRRPQRAIRRNYRWDIVLEVKRVFAASKREVAIPASGPEIDGSLSVLRRFGSLLCRPFAAWTDVMPAIISFSVVGLM